MQLLRKPKLLLHPNMSIIIISLSLSFFPSLLRCKLLTVVRKSINAPVMVRSSRIGPCLVHAWTFLSYKFKPSLIIDSKFFRHFTALNCLELFSKNEMSRSLTFLNSHATVVASWLRF